MNHSTGSRSAPPAPLAFSQYSPPGSPSSETTASPDYSKHQTSYGYYSTPRSFSGSYSDASTVVADHPSDSTRPSRKPTSPTGQKNAHSYCGRHSSEWLFSGWNVFSRKGST